LASLGSFATNFSANPAMAPRMRILRVLGTECWMYEGRINNSGANMVNTTQTMFTFNSGYRPLVERGASVYAATSAHFPVRLGLMVSGALTGSVPTGSASPTTIWLDGVCFTNPL
ncbi:hypothetical protein, partial [Streptomyces sp. CC208A]|uniref:hypothetical protein n=1 Tax=Streptomyces sp. CC208A TaxID=3044573 RepID=UPI0024A898D0